MPTPHDPSKRADYARRRLIGQLRRAECPDATALADVLGNCTADTPCGSAACPCCGLAHQQAAVSAVDRFIREPARAIRARMTLVTIVPAAGCVAPNDLTVELCRQIINQVVATFARLDLPASVIGLEVSFNEDLTGEVEPHWCIHVHAIVYDWLSDAQGKALRAAFPRSRWAKRPVDIRALDQCVNGRLYPFKAERFRREAYLKTDDPRRGPYRATRSKDLRPEQAVSLAIVEHQLGFGQRLLSHKIDEGALKRHLEGLEWARDGP